jgi:CubicO group peptidase (beta-lactamase class C family)
MLCVVPAAAQVASSPIDTDAALAAIEKTVEAKRVEMHVPGAALAIVKDDRIIFSRGFGLRDVDSKLPVTPNTQFAIGSCTKAFTAMAAMISQDNGKLSLADPPRKYLPYFKLHDADIDSRITLADMISHRSGLMAYTDIPWITGVLRPDQVIRAMADAVPTAKLGEKFQYNNVMFLAAGECMAAAQNESYAKAIRMLILTPLGMKESNLSAREMLRTADHASGYDLEGAEKSLRRLPMRDITNIAPAGAINSNVIEMSKWIRVMLGKGEMDGKRLVSSEGYADLVSPHISVGPGVAYGYGWVLDTWQGHRRIWHNGGIDGFNSHLAMLPDEHLGFILLTNISESGLPQAVVDAVFTNLVHQDKSSTPASGPTEATSDKNPAGEAGDYMLQLGENKLALTVKYRDGRLYAQASGQPEFTMKLVGDRRYTLEPPAPPQVFLQFRGAASKQPELTLEQGGRTIVANPAEHKQFDSPITVTELMQKVVDASGGDAALRAHKTMRLKLTLNMENEGVTGDVTQYTRFPGSSAEIATLYAAGRKIGLTHDFYDGNSGRSETTFTAPELFTGASLADAKIGAAILPELEWKALFKSVVIDRKDKVEGEDVYVVLMTPEVGTQITEYISTNSYLPLKRETGGGTTERYHKYQKVGDKAGQIVIPFEIDKNDTSGHSIITVKQVRFDLPIVDDLLKPGYGRCRQ